MTKNKTKKQDSSNLQIMETIILKKTKIEEVVSDNNNLNFDEELKKELEQAIEDKKGH